MQGLAPSWAQEHPHKMEGLLLKALNGSPNGVKLSGMPRLVDTQ